MYTIAPTSAQVDYVSTGGTSGAPLQFYIGADRSSVEYAYLIASWQRAGYRPGVPLAVFRGRIVPPDASGLRHEYDRLLKHHYYSNFHMTDGQMQRYLGHVGDIGPCFLHVYPSAIEALARFVVRAGISAPRNIRGIIAESEIVYPEQRALAESVFGCRYFSSYGMTEKVVAAAECESSSHYHVWPTYGYFELLDESGAPVRTPGDRGEIVGTGYINSVVPFIRYRTGDYATYVAHRCEGCGREHPVIKDIRGHRVQESLVASDGALISWTSLNMHDDTFERVLRFQFVQVVPGKAHLKVIPGVGFGAADGERIQRNLGLKLDGRLEFVIETVDSIELSRTGKVIYVDQRVPLPHLHQGPA
jgi:phenylacetate-CoA ligase